ncbi:MAG: Na/Pi symporter [Myxococcales bacterium]|nr:Na/Pi symporter [Myxococcales bacterium]MDD9971699.1 Na/Pi symporter [Myxococcales bacterium]
MLGVGLAAGRSRSGWASLGLSMLVPMLAALALALVPEPGVCQVSEPPQAASEQTPTDAKKLSIRWLQPVELRPGAALIVHAEGLQPGASVEARLSGAFGKREVPVLRRERDRVAIRVPHDLPAGAVKLRIYQGERKSKPRLAQVREPATLDRMRDAIGGLAVFLLGLTLVSRAFRNYAGQSLRTQLARLTQNGARCLSLGTLVGGLTQATTSSAGILLGMLGARLLSQRAALHLLLGIQVGAATAGAFLPLFASRQGLWVVTLGGLLSLIARNRKTEALGRIVLGCGLMLVGLSFLQSGIRPLVAEPEILPYLQIVSGEGVVPAAAGVAVGALLAALLQGPGPAFAVVLSLTQSTTLLSLSDGLTMLAGTPLGATLGTLVLGAPAGAAGRRLAVGHVLLGISMFAIMLVGIPVWTHIAEALVGGDAARVVYGENALRPEMAGHLGAAFIVAQAAAAVGCLPLRDPLDRLCQRISKERVPAAAAGAELQPDLIEVLGACRSAVLALGEVVATRERGPAVQAETAIARARSAVSGLLTSLERRPAEPAIDLATITACLHLATATDGALRVAERALELDLATDEQGAQHLARVQSLLVEGMEALVAHVSGLQPLSLEEVQAREIRLNALEAEARSATGRGESLSNRLWLSELSSACEAVGNHIYRLGTALASTPFHSQRP